MAVKHQEWTQNDRANKGLRVHGGEPVECEHRDGPVYFNRSPRVEGRYAGQEFAPPEVPTEKDDQPFPRLAMVAPVLLGVSMWLIFDRPAALLFVLMSPMMLIGNFFMNRSKDQRLVKRSIGRFDTRLAALSAQLLTERTLEQQAGLGESPSTVEALTESFERGPLRWTRRPEHWSFPGETITDVAVESVDSATALHFACRLAPVIDAGALIADSSDLPRSVSMVTLRGHDLESVSLRTLRTLRTLAIAAGRTSAGGPVAVYGLDFAAGSLRRLEPLPHVGSMIGGGGDIERINRLFGLLKAELEARGNRFVEATASTIAEYRALANRPNEPPQRAAHSAAHRRVRGLSGRLGGREWPVELVRRVPQHPLGWSSSGRPRGFYRRPGQPAHGARRRKPRGLSADPGRCRAG